MWEKTVTSNMSMSNLKNFNLENESGELKVFVGNWKIEWLNFFKLT